MKFPRVLFPMVFVALMFPNSVSPANDVSDLHATGLCDDRIPGVQPPAEWTERQRLRSVGSPGVSESSHDSALALPDETNDRTTSE